MSEEPIVSEDVRLPPDLLHLLCAELASRSDFLTLYNCVVSSKHFAGSGALANLYRASHNAPVKGGGNEALPLAEQELIFQKWSIMWRTILLSCLGETMFPYCRYLRVLDLRDVYLLLDDDKFRGKVQQNFFSGSLAKFNITSQTRSKNRAQRSNNLREMVTGIGNAIVDAAPLLEELTEPTVFGQYNILSGALPRWTPGLSRLRSLELWDGKTLGDETIQNLLHAHCPHLNRISMYQWMADDSDHQLAQFLSNMPRNTLAYFENIGECGIGPETCLALNTHSKSLKVLALAIPDQGMDGLGLMKSCTAIERLKLTDTRPPHDFKESHNDTLTDMIDWLKQCTQLREISLTNFVSAPDILTPVLNEEGIELEELQVSARDDCMYVLKEHQDFHAAIGLQTRLQSLSLKADPEPMTPDSRNQLCESLCELRDLRYLKLTRSSDYFQDPQLQLFGENLLKLEDLTVSGWLLGDQSLTVLSNLVNLKSVTFNGLSQFTTDGLLEFIDKLGSGNRGLALSIDMAAVEAALSSEEQDLIREMLFTKVQGRFEYQLVRDPEVPEFTDSDSD